MARLSITTAWNETVAFVKREGRLLFPLAFLLLALPMALLQLVMPETPPGENPPPGAWMLVLPLVFIATMVGNIALSFLALRPGASVGEAIGRGARRFVPLMLAAIMVGFAAAILFFVAAMIAVALVPGATESLVAGAPPTPAASGAIALMVLIALPVILFFAVRLLLMTPVAADEDRGPIAIIARSWQLTRGRFWKLLGFLILVSILFMVVSFAVGAVIGLLVILVAGQPQPGNAAMFAMILVNAALSTVISVYLVTLIARIYAQLAGGADAEANAFTPEI